MDLFINTSLNYIPIRSRLVSQPKSKLISNSEQSINATHLSPITFGVILLLELSSKISTNSQINPVNSDKNKISKYVLSKYY